MNDSRSYITLDFRNTHMPVVVKVKRGDTARTLYISLADGGTPYLIADGCTATFTAKKPDKTVINNSCTIEGNMIVYQFTEQTCSKDGRITAEIRLYGSNGKMLTSASFVLEIHKTVLGPNDIPASESQMNALDALILETTALKAETKTLKEEVERKLENGDFVGDPGKSAYECAVEAGYTGSEEEWLESLIGKSGHTPVKGVDYFTDEEQEKMSEEVAKLFGDRIKTIETEIADLKYVPIDIAKFSNSAGTVEMGSVVNELTLSWTLNKAPASQTVNGESMDVAARSKKLTGLALSANKTFSMSATDERGATDSASTTVNFHNGIYYGAGAVPATLDSAFILALTKTLSSTKGRTIDVTASDGQHIWYALPKRLGACKFAVGGFEGGFDLVATIDFKNSKGYTELYYIYRSGQTGLGATKVVIS